MPIALNKPTSLAGLMLPVSTPGFAVPVFRSDESLYVQHADEREIISGFVPIGPLESPIVTPRPLAWSDLQLQNTEYERGMPLQYGFVTGDRSLAVGERQIIREHVRKWLAMADDRMRARHPFVVLDALEFVGAPGEELAQAVDLGRRWMAKRGLNQADRWAAFERSSLGLPEEVPTSSSTLTATMPAAASTRVRPDTRDDSAEVKILCPVTRRPVGTGIIVPRQAVAHTIFGRNTFGPCPECGGTHTWDKDDVLPPD